MRKASVSAPLVIVSAGWIQCEHSPGQLGGHSKVESPLLGWWGSSRLGSSGFLTKGSRISWLSAAYIITPWSICFKFERQLARRPLEVAALTAGNISAATIPKMVITTNNSTSVNAVVPCTSSRISTSTAQNKVRHVGKSKDLVHLASGSRAKADWA